MTDATPVAPGGAPVDAKSFWRMLGMRAVGVAIVTAQGEAGPAGFLALSVTHVTADPPSMLVSIDDRTQALTAILHSRHFAINYLSSTDEGLADSFGGRGALKGADRFETGRWRTLATGAPILTSAIGSIDCALAETFRYHSTTIAIGRAVGFESPDLGCGLVYFGGRYRSL